VVGVLNGYSNLMQFSDERPLEEDRDYMILDHAALYLSGK
jgi:hypothetical protein